MATVVARSANINISRLQSSGPAQLGLSEPSIFARFSFSSPTVSPTDRVARERDVSRPETLHLGAPETPTRRERCRAHLGDQGNPIEEHAPPRPRAAPQAPAEAGRRDLARASRGLARRCDGVVPRPERPRRGRVLGHFQRRHRAFVRFRARFRCPRAVRARGTGSTARRCPPGVPKCLRRLGLGTFRRGPPRRPRAPAGHASPAPRRLVRRGVLEPEGRPPRRRVGDRARGGDVGRARGRSVRGGGKRRRSTRRSLTRHGTNERFAAR